MKRYTKTLPALLTGGLLLSSVGGLHAGMTVTSINSADPTTIPTTLTSLGLNTSASVFTVEGDGGFNRRNVNGNRLNTQTFQVGTSFILDSIFFEYQNGGYADGNVTLSIYNVADVNAPTLTLGSLVVAGTFVDNATTRAAAGFISGGNSVLQFGFTGSDQVSLGATSGTAGYALQFTTDTGGSAVFALQRSNFGYAGGAAYETGASVPSLDYAMALTAVTVPEPSTMALAGMGGLGMLFALRRRSV